MSQPIPIEDLRAAAESTHRPFPPKVVERLNAIKAQIEPLIVGRQNYINGVIESLVDADVDVSKVQINLDASPPYWTVTD